MSRDATHEVVTRNEKLKYIVIRDVGIHDRQLTVTNDVEGVIKRLWDAFYLIDGTRLFFYDSGGELDEIVITWHRQEGYSGQHFMSPLFASFRVVPPAHHDELPAYVEDQNMVYISGGRWDHRRGRVVETDGDMMIVELERRKKWRDKPAAPASVVRVASEHMFHVAPED